MAFTAANLLKAWELAERESASPKTSPPSPEERVQQRSENVRQSLGEIEAILKEILPEGHTVKIERGYVDKSKKVRVLNAYAVVALTPQGQEFLRVQASMEDFDLIEVFRGGLRGKKYGDVLIGKQVSLSAQDEEEIMGVIGRVLRDAGVPRRQGPARMPTA